MFDKFTLRKETRHEFWFWAYPFRGFFPLLAINSYIIFGLLCESSTSLCKVCNSPSKRRQLIGAIGQSYTSYLSTINCKSIFLFRFRNLLRNIALNSVGMYVYMVCMFMICHTPCQLCQILCTSQQPFGLVNYELVFAL